MSTFWIIAIIVMILTNILLIFGIIKNLNDIFSVEPMFEKCKFIIDTFREEYKTVTVIKTSGEESKQSNNKTGGNKKQCKSKTSTCSYDGDVWKYENKVTISYPSNSDGATVSVSEIPVQKIVELFEKEYENDN